MTTTQPKTTRPEPHWVADVLRFWFEELTETDWYSKQPSVDARIHEDFRNLHATLGSERDFVPRDAREALACVIVLDQFSRHLFRDDPRAYATDAIARSLAGSAIARGFDRNMGKLERLFFYLPFQHSEDRADQARSLELIQSLDDDDMTHHAVAHKAIIDRFGRFPHRNAVLGRASTAAELAFLVDPANSY